MTKNELIKKLQSINGNPVVLISGEGIEYFTLNGVKIEKMHQSYNDQNEYIADKEFESEIGYNTYCHDNYKANTEDCIIFTLYE